MAMDVVSVQFVKDCLTRSPSIRFSLEVPVPPKQVDTLKTAMENGDWTTFKTQAKSFTPTALSAAFDFLMTVAPQKQQTQTNTDDKKTT